MKRYRVETPSCKVITTVDSLREAIAVANWSTTRTMVFDLAAKTIVHRNWGHQRTYGVQRETLCY